MATEAIITGITPKAAQEIANAMLAAKTGGPSSSGGGASREDESQQIETGIETRKDEVKAVKNSSLAVKQWAKDLHKSSQQMVEGLKEIFRGQTTKRLLSEYQAQVKAGMQSFEDAEGYVYRSLAAYKDLGVTVEQLSEANKTSRMATLNMAGGVEEWTDKMQANQLDYFARIGNHSEALKHQSDMLEMTTKAGLGVNEFFGKFERTMLDTDTRLLAMGVSMEQSREMMKKTLADENVRRKLAATDNLRERQQLMLELKARKANFIALGMTTEQAEAAAKELNKLAGEDPLERFKRAAQLQAAAGAMGIEGGAEAAQILRLGDRATTAQTEQLREFLGRLQDAGSEARTGAVGYEFMVSSLLKQLDLKGLVGAGGVMSTKLGEQVAVTQDQITAIEMVGKDTKKLNSIADSLMKIETFLVSSPAAGLAKLLGGGWDFLAGAFATAMGLSGLKGLMGGKGPGKGTASAVGKGASALGGIAKFAGAAGVAAISLEQFHQAVTTGTSDVYELLDNTFPAFTEALGNFIGKTVDTWSDPTAAMQNSGLPRGIEDGIGRIFDTIISPISAEARRRLNTDMSVMDGENTKQIEAVREQTEATVEVASGVNNLTTTLVEKEEESKNILHTISDTLKEMLTSQNDRLDDRATARGWGAPPVVSTGFNDR